MHNEEDSDEGASREAHKSNITKVSAVATVSPAVALVETSRSIQTFQMSYDRIYREFQERLVAEYAGMRNVYIGEY